MPLCLRGAVRKGYCYQTTPNHNPITCRSKNTIRNINSLVTVPSIAVFLLSQSSRSINQCRNSDSNKNTQDPEQLNSFEEVTFPTTIAVLACFLMEMRHYTHSEEDLNKGRNVGKN